MIPVRKEHNLQQFGSVKSTNAMTISATPEMFDLLSSGIYKNPIQAVVREYLANACDESDTVDIVCPSNLNLYFKVRDYGSGMSEQFVMELFSSYGFSDKTTNNNQIGGFGIGSKSGFAYTDSFTVRSWVDGVVSTYECTKTNEGLFNISLRGSRDTDEPSGVEIIIPVKRGDQYKFIEYIQYFTDYLSFFRKIKFNGLVETPAVFKHIKGDLYSASDGRGINGNIIVVMGGIPYQCNTGDILSNSKSAILGSSKFVVTRPIGSLAITASRESIRYNDDTVKALKPIFEDAVKDLLKHHTEALSKLTTIYDKYCYVIDLPSNVKNSLDVNKYVIDIDESELISCNKNGSIKTTSWYSNKNIFSNPTNTWNTYVPSNIIVIDTDKFVPSRIKAAWEDVGSNVTLIKPINSLSLSEAELKKYGVPYKLLSSYEPLKKKRTKNTHVIVAPPAVTKDEALVVYYNPRTEYKYSHEQKLDLANPGIVCYYDRNTEKDYEYQIDRLQITEGYSVISATNKNLSKLKSSSVPHIKTVIDSWVKTKLNSNTAVRNAYLNTHWVIPKDLYRVCPDVNQSYSNTPSFLPTTFFWKELPDYVTKNYDPKEALDYKDELLSKLKYIKGLTVKSYDGTKDILLFEHLNRFSFNSAAGVS